MSIEDIDFVGILLFHVLIYKCMMRAIYLFTSYLHFDNNNNIKLEIKNLAAANAFFYQF